LKTAFLKCGNFYRGNLHCHTARSDGRLQPEDLAAAYRERGYDFLCFTDHNIYTDLSGNSTADFLILPGMEINPPPQPGNDSEFHFLALPGTRRDREAATLPPYVHGQELRLQARHDADYLQSLLDDAHARGSLLALSHPYWSRVEYDQVLALRHLFAIDAYNFCSAVIENAGESFSCWDAVLRRGGRLWGLAVDDTHNFYPLNAPGNDAFGGYTMVKAASLSQDDVMEAIALGSFYSSAGGPEIKDFYIRDGRACLLCSPAERIYFSSQARQYRWLIAEQSGNSLTGFECDLRGDELYIRAECYDERGRRSFTNPIWLSAEDGDGASDATGS
jgi:hypothetical protein